MTLLLMLLLKSLVVFALSGAVLLCLRRASASARHLVCLLTLSALLALPLFSVALPGWQIAALQEEPTPPQAATLPKREGTKLRAAQPPAALPAAASLGTVPSPRSAAPTKTPRLPVSGGQALVPGGFLAFYLFGVVLASIRPLLGLWGIAHLHRACVPVTDAATLSVSADCAAALRLSRLPQLFRADVPVPMTWGGRRPVVLLPSGSEGWPEDRLRSVLLHEMAHVKRRDWTCHRFADFVCALYWFHPLVWLTARRLRSESEIACDDLVLSSGVPAPEYARHLLEIAGALPRPLPSQSALAMAQTPHLKRRLLMILDKTLTRRTVTRRALLVALVPSAAALLLLAALRPSVKAQTPSASRKSAALTESQTMQRDRQFAWENAKFMRGQQFSPQQALVQEKQIATNPDDYTARLCLLGCDLDRGFFGKPPLVAAARQDYRRQAFWLIQNHPESPLFSRAPLDVPRRYAPAMFEGDKALWQEQIAGHPGSAVVLGNAAGYYLLSDKALAESYLLRAQALEPSNPDWPTRLGELYRLNGPAPSAAVVTQSAKKALAEYELAATLGSKTSQPSTSVDLAETAFDAGEYVKAKRYAEDLLKQSRRSDNSESDNYVANEVLGRLALRDGNITEAEAHLFAAGHVPASGMINARKPMQLAKELLEHGDRPPVAAFLENCTRIYQFPVETRVIKKWETEVENGKTPDFEKAYLN